MTPYHPLDGRLIERYEPLFPPGLRRDGESLARAHEVAVIRGTSRTIQAIILESPACRVQIERQGNTIRSSCPCDHASRRDGCRHVWATLVKADDKGYLGELLAYGLRWDFGEGGSSVDPAGTSSWRGLLRALGDRGSSPESLEPESRGGEGQLIYYLDPAETLQTNEIVLHVAVRRRRKSGEWGRPRPKALDDLTIGKADEPSERRALELLQGSRDACAVDPIPGPDFNLNPAQVEVLLPDLCRTGRFFLFSPDDGADLPTPCTWDADHPWKLRVRLDREGGDFVLGATLERPGATMDLGEPVLFLAAGLFFTRDKAARYLFNGDFSWISYLRTCRKVSIQGKDLPKFLREVYALPGRVDIEIPKDVGVEEVEVPPQPSLELAPLEDEGPRLVGARLSFDYDGKGVDGRDPRRQLFAYKENRLLRRDPEAEKSAGRTLLDLGFQRATVADPWPDYEIQVERIPAAVLALVAQGWQVEGEEGIFRQPGKIRMQVTSGIDWFDVSGGVEYGDTVVPIPRLLAALRSGKRFVKLGNGTVGLLPEEWLRRQGLFLAAGLAEGDVLRFSRGQAMLLDALLESDDECTADETFTRIRRGLRRFEGVEPADPPAGFQGTLREYQRVGLGWMRFLREFALGGCLADDMGLGKTVQVLAYLESRRTAKAGASLVVVPRSLLFNWKAEATRFAPSLRVVEHWGQARARNVDGFQDADIVLTTYGTLRRDAPFLKDARFDCVILDEAQAIKNAQSDTAKAARLLKGGQRLALSGTPIENHLGELWSLMEFLNPGLLGRASAFRGALDADAGEDPAVRALLARAIRPFILRRTKEQVAPELPERVEQTISVELDAGERRMYDELKRHYQKLLLEGNGSKSLGRMKFHVLEALLRLRQAACHPGLLDRKQVDEPSSKLEIVLDRLREVVEEGHKALVFSQFTKFLGIVRRVLDGEKIEYEYLDGQTRDREARVKRFQEDPACRVFLVSLKAGGLGLNLTAAEYVFLLDPWWNPAVEAQAIDRTHRIGQTRRVIACRLVAKDTVEEKVLELQKSKRELADAILGEDKRLLANLTRDDLQLLLS